MEYIDFSGQAEIMFNLKTFLEDIYTSYNNQFDIISQFTRDFPRQIVYVDKQQITDTDELFKFAKNKEFNIRERETIPFILLLFMLCCQSSFFSSFFYLHQKLNIGDFHVTDTSHKKEIHISTSDDTTIIQTTFQLLNTQTMKIHKYIKASTVIDLHCEKGMIVYNFF